MTTRSLRCWRLVRPILAIIATMLILITLSGCAGKVVAQSTSHFRPGTGFVQRAIEIDGKPHPLWVFLPRNYDAAQRYPTIVFLHGLFEAGSDGTGALSAGLGPVIAQSPDEWPFIVIFPQ